jgi:hypothetical protein
MSKFTKRILKNIKKPKNALVFGQGLDRMQEISDIFQTLFIIEAKEKFFLGRNVIYRENIENIETLPDIDYIFIDKDKLDYVFSLHVVIRRWSPFILTEGIEEWTSEHTKFLRNKRYRAIDYTKEFYVWKNS